MAAEIEQLTDMINIKMIGMFNLIDKWIPPNNTIKNTILNDIHHIKQEISNFNQQQALKKSNTFPIKLKPKCRNGSSCWYFKQGSCWFAHPTISNEQSNTSANSKQQRAINNSDKKSTSNNNRKKSTKQVQIRKKQKQTKGPINTTATHNNPKKLKQQNNKRKRKKKKKQNIDLLLQCFKDDNEKHVSSPTTTGNPETNSDESTSSPKAEVMLESPQYKNFHDVIPPTYTFETIDKARAILDKDEIMAKLGRFRGHEKEMEILNQVKTICDIAIGCEWTYDQTMQEIDSFIWQSIYA